jgi:hypothetical protein
VSNSSDFPWKDDSPNFIGCNLAVADLINNLPRALTVDGRIHAETLVAASGAIAGFAAQQALWSQNAAISLDVLNETSLTNGLFVVRSPSGDRYVFGDPLKEMVFCRIQPPTQLTARLWERAVGAAQAAGLDSSRLPDALEMWEYVNRSIRQGHEGMPSTPKEHWPGLPPAELLRRFWPFAEQCLTGKLSGEKFPPGIVNVDLKWWPTITGMAVCNMIDKVKTVLDPRTALIIAMETAFFALKIDPQRIAAK